MSAFVDTSALYAMAVASDAHHQRALALWRDLVISREVMLTTNYVLVEALALIQHRLGLAATQAVSEQALSLLVVHWIRPDEHEAAMKELLAAEDGRLSLVDAASFVVMRRRGIERAFAFDDRFREQGFELL